MQNLSLGDVAWIFGSLIVFALICVAGRPAWHLARALKRRYVHVSWQGLLDILADDMSSEAGSEPTLPGSRTGFDDPVLPQQNQVKPELVFEFSHLLDFLSRHNLSEGEAIALLARMRRSNGIDYYLSANRIRDVVGGADAAVKAEVAKHRPKPAVPKPPARLERPANGW
jgi:hypothetical protein